MTQNETIVDRVVARLKAQPLGDLITEEDLHDIVKQAIPKTFFEKRYFKEGSGFHERTVEKEPLLVEVMRELVTPVVRASVEEWLKANAELTAEYWQKVLDEGLVKHVQNVLNDQATAMVRNNIRGWVDAVNQERMRAGLPMIGTI